MRQLQLSEFMVLTQMTLALKVDLKLH